MGCMSELRQVDASLLEEAESLVNDENEFDFRTRLNTYYLAADCRAMGRCFQCAYYEASLCSCRLFIESEDRLRALVDAQRLFTS